MKRATAWLAAAFAASALLGTVPGAEGREAAGQEIKETQAASVWPAPSAFEWYWHVPVKDLSQDRIDSSLAGIKSGFFMSVTNDWKGPLSAVRVTPKRVQFDYQVVGGAKRSYFPVNLLESLRLYYASSQPQGRKWLVVINLTTQGVMQIYFETEAYARAFIDAAASVAARSGISIEEKETRGFVVSDLTPAQVQALGKPRLESALVSMIAYGGPAESAGLRFMDLITDVDGVKVRNADHLVSLLDAAAPGTSLTLTCLERGEAAESDSAASVWKPKTVVWKKGSRP